MIDVNQFHTVLQPTACPSCLLCRPRADSVWQAAGQPARLRLSISITTLRLHSLTAYVRNTRRKINKVQLVTQILMKPCTASSSGSLEAPPDCSPNDTFRKRITVIQSKLQESACQHSLIIRQFGGAKKAKIGLWFLTQDSSASLLFRSMDSRYHAATGTARAQTTSQPQLAKHLTRTYKCHLFGPLSKE